MQYDNRGQVSMWKSDRANGPTLSGKVVAHRDIKEGETLDIALWRQDASGNQPIMKGKINDVWVPSQPKTSVTELTGKEVYDDVPF
ncbi:hypothetical protein N9M50_07645 [Alphaproteobacteria bacterium]|nr:hypothetical protein [Alphaproteobacteria bacterium]